MFGAALWERRYLPHIAFRFGDLVTIGQIEILSTGWRVGPQCFHTAPIVAAAGARMAFVDKSRGHVKNLQHAKLDPWRGEPTPWTQLES